MKKIFYFFISLFSLGSSSSAQPPNLPESFYDIQIPAIDGSPLPLANFKGKVVLVVNTASRCGFTSQYEGLERLYKKYADQGFLILGVPSNDFGGQEPEEEDAIKSFCENRFGVSFPMTEKQMVKGDQKTPLYQYLVHTSPERNGSDPRWNFEKFMVDKTGKVRGRFSSPVEPESDEIIKLIEELLRE